MAWQAALGGVLESLGGSITDYASEDRARKEREAIRAKEAEEKAMQRVLQEKQLQLEGQRNQTSLDQLELQRKKFDLERSQDNRSSMREMLVNAPGGTMFSQQEHSGVMAAAPEMSPFFKTRMGTGIGPMQQGQDGNLPSRPIGAVPNFEFSGFEPPSLRAQRAQLSAISQDRDIDNQRQQAAMEQQLQIARMQIQAANARASNTLDTRGDTQADLMERFAAEKMLQSLEEEYAAAVSALRRGENISPQEVQTIKDRLETARDRINSRGGVAQPAPGMSGTMEGLGGPSASPPTRRRKPAF